MSVLIKDMEMPMVCGACPLAYDFSYCMASQEPLGKLNLDTRHPKCPLIPVPDYPVKHGEWERPVVHGLTCLTALCSVCGYVNNSNDRFKYCPNCGAKMERSEDD